jgi:hypothetical protein
MIKIGSSRFVVLSKNYAFKFPYPFRWERFLRGLLANMQENKFWILKSNKMCPIFLSIPGGFLNVMKRTFPITSEVLKQLKQEKFLWDEENNCKIPGEYKLDSFGFIDGRIVTIDYGN